MTNSDLREFLEQLLEETTEAERQAFNVLFYLAHRPQPKVKAATNGPDE